MDDVVEAMTEHRLQGIKTSLEGLDQLRDTLYDTYDYSVALGDIGRDGLELLEEVERLRKIEASMGRLADAYAANVVMLSKIAQGPDSMLGIMAECSMSTAKMIRKALDE